MFGKLFLLISLALVHARPQERRNQCPPSHSHYLLPHEWDCTRFYYCEYGVKRDEPRSCAPGTHFSYALQVCIHPPIANCQLPNVPPEDNDESCEDENTVTKETDTEPKTTEATNIEKTTEDCPDEEAVQPPTTEDCLDDEIELLPNGCPADFQVDKLLPHETKCNKFYYCDCGVKVETKCEDGKYFNSEIQACDWSDNVDCVSSADEEGADTGSSVENPVDCEILPNGCPADYTQEMLLPHEDCDKFYQCVHGEKVEMPCAPGTHFNPNKQECDWPADAGCTGNIGSGESCGNVESGTCGGGDVGEESGGDVLENGCPADFNEELLLPHEDCDKYYQCVHGEKVKRPCAPGTHFNPNKQECDWPANAGCTGNVGGCGNAESGTCGGGDVGGESGGDVLENGCPADFNEELLLPHEDCDKYYQCVHGEKVERPCAPGTHFNPNKQECDWPANAGCTGNVGGCGNAESGTCVGGDVGGESGGDVLENGCPADFNEELLLPHEDCDKYYQCVHGEKVERPCAAGTHFNPNKQECDWPANAGCTGNVGGCGNAESGTCGGGDVGGESGGDVLENGCPADFNEELLLPHEDCDKYYQCVHGEKVERPCAPGTHFNPNKQECDWPANAGCTGNVGGCGNAESGTCGGGDVGGESGGDVLENGCPADFNEELLLPHEDCDKYYQCVHGEKVERPCAPGTHFNPNKQECDWPANAGCTGNVGGCGNAESGTCVGGDVGGESGGDVLENGCPADFNEELLLPHEDCDKYYQCVHGEKVERPCAAGTHFNPNKQECDWPANAGCTGNVGGCGNAESGTCGGGDVGGESGGDVLENGCPADFNEELLLPHEDCDKYYQCVHGEKVERPCAPGTHFNPNKQECDWPANAGCTGDVGGCGNAESGTCGGGDVGGESGGDVLENGCPADFNEELLLPHEDCDKYYQCVHGEKVERPCAPGTHFNPNKQECDWPANAGCTGNVGGCGNAESGTCGGGDVGGESGGDVLENGCPADFNEELLLPHEDCDKYYQCVHGEKVERPCAPGTHFNPNKQECDWPANAGCTGNVGGCGNAESGTCGGGDVGGESGGDVLENGCPADFNEELLLPHEDCDKYYQCVHGEKVERPCAPGTHFNPNKQECDWPANAGCTGNVGGCGNAESGTCGGGDVGGESGGDVLENGCPADFNEELLLPHEDCDKYYQCVHGEKVERPCAPGTHFNPNKQECDWPANAGCTGNVGGCGNAESGTCGGGDVGGESGGDVLENGCPADFNEELLLPHEDCDKYYQCVHGEKVERPCAPGTHFNPNKQECDWPANAGCTGNVGGCGNAESGTCGGGDVGGESGGDVLENGCPADFNEELLLPHEDCDKYYQCVHGEKVERPCAPGTHFNPNKQECDWPANAGCTGNVGGCGNAESGTCGGGDVGGESGGDVLENGCPADFNEELLLPHEDCDKYYQCVHGEKVERPCAPGTHFNPNKQECDWPANAGCTGNVGGCGNAESGTCGGGDVGGESGGDVLVNGCPADFNEELLLPHEECDKYYQCVHGEKVERPCAPGTHFNPNKQECDWPANAGCAGNVGGCGNAESGTCGGGDVGGESGGDVLENGCPADFNEELLLPHEDCDKYYQCVHGEKVERPCAPGTHFNPNKQECDWPANAGCTGNVGGCGNAESGTCGGGDVGGESGGDVLENGCPADFNEELLLPHEECDKYYQCVHGEKVERPCAPGTHFNPNKQECDWPANAGCTGSDPGNGTDNGQSNCGNGENSGCNPGHPSNDDRCTSECNIGPWAHETDCDKFWRCEKDKAVLVACSEGLHFNSKTRTCDFICNAGCVRENLEATGSSDGLKMFIPWDKIDNDVNVILERIAHGHVAFAY